MSYYPNRGDFTHPLAALDPETLVAHNLDPNDEGIENEDDWLETEQPVGVTRKMSVKAVAALEMEVSPQRPRILRNSMTTFTEALLSGRSHHKCPGCRLIWHDWPWFVCGAHSSRTTTFQVRVRRANGKAIG